MDGVFCNYLILPCLRLAGSPKAVLQSILGASDPKGKQEGDAICEICGSDEAVSIYQLEGEVVLRCEIHAIGINPKAEEIYWRRRSSLDDNDGESGKANG